MGNFLSVISRLKSEIILLVSVLPFLGWIVAFSFEQGYLQYFGFSYDFVEIGLTQTLIASLILLGVVYGAGIVAIFGEPFYDKNRSPFQKRKEAWTLVVLITVVVMVVLFTTSGNEFTFMSITTLTFLIFCVIYTLFFLKKMTYGVMRKNIAYAEIREGLKVVSESKSVALLILLVAIFMILSSVRYFGQLAAEHQIEFMVLTEQSDYVLIRRYGDTYLFRQIDEHTHSQLSGVKPFKIGDGKSIDLKLKYVGPLKKY